MLDTMPDMVLPEGVVNVTETRPEEQPQHQVNNVPLQQMQPPQQEQKPMQITASLDELLKDKRIKSEYDRKITDAINKAIINNTEKEARIRNKSLSIADRLEGLDGQKLKEATLQIFNEQEKEIERQKEQANLKNYTSGLLVEKGLSDSLIGLFDFIDDTTDGVERKISLLDEYLKSERTKWKSTNVPEQNQQIKKTDPFETKMKELENKRKARLGY